MILKMLKVEVAEEGGGRKKGRKRNRAKLEKRKLWVAWHSRSSRRCPGPCPCLFRLNLCLQQADTAF